MPKFIQFSFSGGVFAPEIQGRSDLEKYTLGLSDANNFFIDYRGAASSRAGLEFCEETLPNVRFARFRYNNRLANNYLLVITARAIRFIQNGGYVLDEAKSGTISGGVVSSVAHGFVLGDIVRINQFTFAVFAPTTDTFELRTLTGAAVTYSPAGTQSISRTYAVEVPYISTDLADLSVRQSRNEVRITHPNYPPARLRRNDHNDWTYELLFEPLEIQSPANMLATPTVSGSASINYTVTAVNADGQESAINTIKFVENIVNYAVDQGGVTFTWDISPTAQYYKIYRSIIFPKYTEANFGQQLGLIGTSYSTSFTDNNIIPDYTQSPPVYRNPFAPGQISSIDITSPGSYASVPVVGISDPEGSGFVGLPIMSGAFGTYILVGILILNPGSGYVSPTLTLTGGEVTPAEGTVNLGEEGGLYPSGSVKWNQRQWFFGNEAFPLRLYASRPGDENSFYEGLFPTDTDPIYLDIESEEMTPIRFGEILGESLFVFTDQAVWQVSYNETGYIRSRRTEQGIGYVPPLVLGRDVIFVSSQGTGVYAVKPANVQGYYVDEDISLYAAHLFSKEQEIVSWAYAREPFRLVWSVTKDGYARTLTYVSDQNVYAWAPHDTKGLFKQVETVTENGQDRPYFAVERNGRYFIERMAVREPRTVEDQWAVDCGLATTLVYPAADLEISGSPGEPQPCVASAAVFSSGDVGKHLRAGGGRGRVVSYTSSTEVSVLFDIPIEERLPQDSGYPTFFETTWSLSPLVTTVSNLDHLEGQEVEIFADGMQQESAVVTNGAVELQTPASHVVVGLGYSGFFRPLPLSASDAVIEDNVKRITAVKLRLQDTRNLHYGFPGHTYQMPERTDEPLYAPTRLQQGLHDLPVLQEWNPDEPLHFEKRGPYLVSVLSIIFQAEIGDDLS